MERNQRVTERTGERITIDIKGNLRIIIGKISHKERVDSTVVLLLSLSILGICTGKEKKKCWNAFIRII